MYRLLFRRCRASRKMSGIGSAEGVDILEGVRTLFDSTSSDAIDLRRFCSTSSTVSSVPTGDGRNGKKRRRGKKRPNAELEAVESLDEVEVKRVFRPNYFLAVQIDDEEIVRNAREVQDCVVEREPLLRRALVHPSTFHVTLLVLTLRNEAEVARASELLDVGADSLGFGGDPPIELRFGGLGHFRNQVLYAKPANENPGGSALNRASSGGSGEDGSRGREDDDGSDRLKELQRRLSVRFGASELEVDGANGFEPHLTLFKLSKDPRLRKAGLKKIAPELYAEHRTRMFGAQRVTKVQLLSMLKPKDSSGYYHCCHEVHFVPVRHLSTSPALPEDSRPRRTYMTALICASATLFIMSVVAWRSRSR